MSNKKRVKKKILKTCQVCNKIYTANKNANSRGLCSHACQGKLLKEKYRNGSLVYPEIKHTEETKKKISLSMMGNKNANHRVDRQSFYKDVRFDSSWEVAVAKWLDKNNIVWEYGKQQFKLSDGRTYTPDFCIIENNTIKKFIEVKGYFRQNNKIKFNMFVKEYPYINIEIWDKNILKDMNLISASGYCVE
jgi:hypothetical protein